MSSSRISLGDSLKKEPRRKSLTSLDGIFRRDFRNIGNDQRKDPEEIVATVEAIARENQKTIIGGNKSSQTIFSKREYAQTLHRQADVLHHKGDYEMALVLYHRAANACPRETSHSIAARRTAAAINSVTNSAGALKKIHPRVKKVAQLVGISCPETAAQRAKKIVEESADPISAIDQILKYFDSRKDFPRDRPIFRDRLRRSTLVSRSRTMLRQLGSMASVALENLQAAFAAGDLATSLRIGNELLAIAESLVDRYRYEVAARHYLAMTQIALGRHDRAVDQVTWMIGSAMKSADASLRSRSFMTLGRVHLTFRHLDAAARAWERLVRSVDEAVPKAWLLHEIGRCYFEMKNYGEALEVSYRCLEYAEEGNSRKWLLHAQLLCGQALVELGRFGQAVTVLEKVRTIADEEGDKGTREYVSELIDRITEALRRLVPIDEVLQPSISNDDSVVENKVSRAKSEDVKKSDGSKVLEWSRRKSENLVNETMRLKMKLAKSRGKKIGLSKDLRKINSKIVTKKWRRMNITKIVKSSVEMSSSEESEIFEDDILRDYNVDLKDVPDGTRDELLTSRTRVIKKNREDDGSLGEALFCEDKLVLEDRPGSGDEEPSIVTGKTYVLDDEL